MWSLLRKDLGEFVSTLKDDAAVTIQSAMSLGEEGEYEYSDYESGEEGESEEDGPRQQQTASAALRAMRADIKTYIEDVSESEGEPFAAFIGTFDVGARTREIATLLKEDPVVTNIHTQLVPEHLSYDDFWARYFFRAERVAKGKAGGGLSFPRDDEEEDEDFGWGEDDQEDSNGDDNNNSNKKHSDSDNDNDKDTDADNRSSNSRSAAAVLDSSPTASGKFPSPFSSSYPPNTVPAGGAIGATMSPPSSLSEKTPQAGETLITAVDGSGFSPAEQKQVSKALASAKNGGDGVVATVAPAGSAAEIDRLAEALRASEAERLSLSQALSLGESAAAAGVESIRAAIEKLTEEREAAAAEVKILRAKLHQAETDCENALENFNFEKRKLQEALEESESRVAAAEEKEEEARAQVITMAAAEERAATSRAAAAEPDASTGGGGGGSGGVHGGGEGEVGAGAEAKAVAVDLVEAEAAVESASKEVLRLKKAFREERKEHEAMLWASRQVANEAVEAALSSADADREEACAELAAKMKVEADCKDEELEALRAQLANSAAVTEEAGTLRADVAELRRAAEIEKEAAARAASEARQEAEVAKQLREEVLVLRAAAYPPSASTPADKENAGSASSKRGTTGRADIGGGGEDEDGWGEDEDDSCCAASTNSSGVVVDRPPSSATSPRRDSETHHHRPNSNNTNGSNNDTNNDTNNNRSDDGDGSPSRWSSEKGAQRVGARDGDGPRKDAEGSGARDGEGDEGWEGWD